MGNEEDYSQEFRDDTVSRSYQPVRSEKPPAPPVEIPIEVISEDALTGVIENYITREGTDYGMVEVNHETKVRQIRDQIHKGYVKIVFDPDSESVTIMSQKQWDDTQAAYAAAT
ncbi:MAG: YheU family protein [Bdellovibrionota bacterium]